MLDQHFKSIVALLCGMLVAFLSYIIIFELDTLIYTFTNFFTG